MSFKVTLYLYIFYQVATVIVIMLLEFVKYIYHKSMRYIFLIPNMCELWTQVWNIYWIGAIEYSILLALSF